MDNKTRLHYLEAMGIDVWISRNKITQPKSLVNEQPVAESQSHELSHTKTPTVYDFGNQNADWMIVAEISEQNESLNSDPFAGQEGKLLIEMVRAIGLEKDAVYIAMLLKSTSTHNKIAKAEGIISCFDYLQQQINQVNPKIIVAFGPLAAKILLDTNTSLENLRGISHTLLNTPVVVVYHPHYLLQSLSEKRKAWQDLQFAIKQINQ